MIRDYVKEIVKIIRSTKDADKLKDLLSDYHEKDIAEAITQLSGQELSLIHISVAQGFVPENVFLERLHDIAVNAIGDACTGSNPRQPSVEEMEKLLKCCYYDTEVDF